MTGNLKYIPSTVITSSYFDGETLTRVDNPQQTIDQSANFSVDKKLDFPIGTIKLGDIWEAKYTLQVLTNGTINVFGPSSNVKFTGTEGFSQIMVPKTYITAIEEMQRTVIGIPTLDLKVAVSMPRGHSPLQAILYLEADPLIFEWLMGFKRVFAFVHIWEISWYA